jgi:hypothetical protein
LGRPTHDEVVERRKGDHIMMCDPVVEPGACGWGCHRHIERWFIAGGSGIDEVRVRVVGGVDHHRP